MRALTDLVPLVAFDLPDAPQPIILQQAVLVLRDFCDVSQAWDYDIDPQPILAGEVEYDVDDMPRQAEVSAVKLVKMQDTELMPGRDYEFGQTDKTFIKLLFTPAERIEDALTATIILRPSLTATEVDEQLWRDYHDAIAAGVRFYMMRMPKKPWSNLPLADFWRNDYERRRSMARIDVTRGKGTPLGTVARPSRRV